MIIKCTSCPKWFEDVFRSIAFPANDGNNNFAVHDDAYLSDDAPPKERIFEAHK